MGLEKVIEEINERAKKQSDELIKKAEDEARTLKSDVKSKLAQEEKHSIETLQRDIERKRTYELAKVEIEAKKIILNAQKEILHEAQEKVKENLQAMPEDINRRILSSLLASAEKDLGEGYLYCSERDKSFLGAFKAFHYKGLTGGGGLVAENKDQTVRLDFRYPSLLEGVWDKNISEIAKVLLRA